MNVGVLPVAAMLRKSAHRRGTLACPEPDWAEFVQVGSCAQRSFAGACG